MIWKDLYDTRNGKRQVSKQWIPCASGYSPFIPNQMYNSQAMLLCLALCLRSLICGNCINRAPLLSCFRWVWPVGATDGWVRKEKPGVSSPFPLYLATQLLAGAAPSLHCDSSQQGRPPPWLSLSHGWGKPL